MQITINGVVSTVIDIFALYIASLLLKCSDITKWVIWTYIVLRVLDLLYSIYSMFYPPNRGNTGKIDNPSSWTAIGFALVVLFIIALVLFVIDLYVLFKMYKCETVSKNIFWSFLAVCVVGWLIKAFLPNK
jgi:hypothetical protein